MSLPGLQSVDLNQYINVWIENIEIPIQFEWYVSVSNNL